MKQRIWIWMLIFAMVSTSAMAAEYPDGTLYRGIKGHAEEVEFLQYQLFYAGYLGSEIGEVDGIFGRKTEEAVKAFQQDHDLEPNGVVGFATQMALDETWENSMEPQPIAADESDYCYVERYANGTSSVVLCERHLQRYGEAAALLDAAANDELIIEALQSGITVWLEDMDGLYAEWIAFEPDAAQWITDIQNAFLDYYRAKLALWNRQYGAPSMAALEKAREMLSEHCTELCCRLGEENDGGMMLTEAENAVISAMLVTNCEDFVPFYSEAAGQVAEYIPVNTILRNCRRLNEHQVEVQYNGKNGYVDAEYLEVYSELLHYPARIILTDNLYDSGVAAQEPALNVAWAEDFALDAYDYGAYIQEETDVPCAKFVLYADEAVEDVHLFELEMLSIDEETGVITFSAALEHIQPWVDAQHPLYVSAVMAGMIPNLAVGYQDARGVYHFAFAEISGKDGSMLLSEF